MIDLIVTACWCWHRSTMRCPNSFQYNSSVRRASIVRNTHDVRWPWCTLAVSFVSFRRHDFSNLATSWETISNHMNIPMDYLCQCQCQREMKIKKEWKRSCYRNVWEISFSFSLAEKKRRKNFYSNLCWHNSFAIVIIFTCNFSFSSTAASHFHISLANKNVIFVAKCSTYRQCQRHVMYRWSVPSLLREYVSICCFECSTFPTNLDSQMHLLATLRCCEKKFGEKDLMMFKWIHKHMKWICRSQCEKSEWCIGCV